MRKRFKFDSIIDKKYSDIKAKWANEIENSIKYLKIPLCLFVCFPLLVVSKIFLKRKQC